MPHVHAFALSYQVFWALNVTLFGVAGFSMVRGLHEPCFFWGWLTAGAMGGLDVVYMVFNLYVRSFVRSFVCASVSANVLVVVCVLGVLGALGVLGVLGVLDVVSVLSVLSVVCVPS